MTQKARSPLGDLVKVTLPVFALLLAGAAAACESNAGSAEPTGPPATPSNPAVRVITTTNIVADWVENIGGDHVEVFSLVPIGADPHAFQPGAQDVARIADADLVLAVGLGLEDSWLKELLQNAARDPSTIVELGGIVDPLEFGASHGDDLAVLEDLSHLVDDVAEGEIDPEAALEEIKELLAGDEGGEEDEDHGGEDHLPDMVLAVINDVEDGRMEADDAIEAIEVLAATGEDEHAGHGHGIHDPHFWFDPLRVKRAVNDITVRLSALDPDRGKTYGVNASAYNTRLDELHAWTEEQVGMLPEDRRLLVTSHDSLGYFAQLYGFKVVGVILSITTEVEPAAADLADLVEEVKEYGVKAVFGETTVSERLATAVAAETGARLVRLHSGSLGPAGSGAETYIEMLRTNVGLIIEALT